MGWNDYLINDIDGNASTPSASVLVVRDQQHHLNLSGGKEILVPSRLLYGLIPEALLEAYTFWQDESVVPQGTTIDDFPQASRGYKRLRGYPTQSDGEFMVFVELTSIGSYEDFIAPSSSRNNRYCLLLLLLISRLYLRFDVVLLFNVPGCREELSL
jgi:hypothetical protein